MKVKRVLYWTVLALAGLGSLGLKLWALVIWSGSGGPQSWWNLHAGVPVFPFWGFGPPLLLVLLVGAVWYRRRGMPHGQALNAWETLGLEYVEGRITRDEFLARRAVLEE